MRSTLVAASCVVVALCAAGASAQAAPRGCSKAGVAGPWLGHGVVTLVHSGRDVDVTFTDDFTVTSDDLTGHMRFRETAGRRLPPLVSEALSEEYTVHFEDADGISFSSNWGTGGGWWTDAAYEMTFRSHVGRVRVVERGTIESCGAMTILGEFYEMGVLVATMTAHYERPAGG
jgi:hypothetical protein